MLVQMWRITYAVNAYFCRVRGISILGKIDAYFPPAPIGDMAAESGTSLETRDTEIRDESIENLDTGDELMATLDGQDKLEAEGDNTGDGIGGSALEDIGFMEDLIKREKVVLMRAMYDMEDCELESEADAYIGCRHEEDDLDYMEVC